MKPNDNEFWLLIAGSRSYTDYEEMKKITDYILSIRIRNNNKIVIVSGGANGADSLAERYAHERQYDIKVMKADWKIYGKSAGFIRNRKMHATLAEHPNRGVLCFWDGTSKGTSHNFELAKEFDTQIRVYDFKKKTFVNM